MAGVSGFIAAVEKIAAQKPTYRTGGTGKDGTCDCIGLIMCAMYAMGHKKYDLHSTNYFARFQIDGLMKIKDEKDLFPGQILFRSRTSTDKLHARYQSGGSHYTGDLLDYYHVGVVTRVKPLRIVECTEYGSVKGIMISTKLKNWTHGGALKGVLYDGYSEEDYPVITASVPQKVLYRAKVVTQTDPLSVREWPVTGTIIGKVPKERIVEVLAEAGDGWPKIRYNELVGYASQQYLSRIDEESSDGEELDGLIEDVLQEAAKETVTIIDSEGNTFRPVGDFKVLRGAID